MKNLKMGLLTGLALAIIIPVASFAAGPTGRPTFTAENPADYPSFNAITNNPVWGDERNFVRVRDVNTSQFVNEINVEVGKEYEVMAFFHNNAKSEYNTDDKQSGIAKNVRMRIQQPDGLVANKKTAVTSTITSNNTNPAKVWDEAYLTSSTNVALRYVPGTAKIKTNLMDNKALPTSMFDENGVLIGYDKLNGLVPGCTQYFGYVYYRIVVDKPGFAMSKSISVENKNTFSKNLSSKSGDTLDYKITYKNTGTTLQNNVLIKDVLPKGLEYVKGSTKLVNAALPNGKAVNDDLFTKGVNVGHYGPNTTAEITYKVKVSKASELLCGVNKLTNKASVVTENGTKEDKADVTINVDCKPDECKPGILIGDPKCEEEFCTVPGKENLKPDDPGCKEDSVLPAELPKTGPMEAAMIIIALTAVSAGVAYWYRSREEVKKATMMASGDKTKNVPASAENVEQKTYAIQKTEEVKKDKE